MMDNHPAKPVGPDDTPGSTAGRKLGTSAQQPPEQGLKCPRCDSPNTKFCYYNNYSLTQPRHFCKTCRRYWTKGGALRNVPIGGGCRKSKKSRSSSNLSSSSPKDTASAMSTDSIIGGTGSSGGLKFLQHGGLSPAMEFHLGGLPFSRLHSPAPGAFNHFFSFGDLSSTATLSTNSPSAFEPVVPGNSASLMGLNYPISSGIFNSAIQEIGSSASSSSTASSSSSLHIHSSLASSIESLSCINQDLHWKLQQQRLGLLFGGENQKDSSISAVQAPLLENQQQPISFRAPDSLKTEDSGNNSRKVCAGENASDWFFGSSYGAGNGNSSSNNTGNWSEIQTWNDLHQYSALP